MSFCLYIYLSIVYLSIRLFIFCVCHTSIYQSSLSWYPSIYLTIYIFIYLFVIYLPICLSIIYLFNDLHIHLSIHPLPIYPSTFPIYPSISFHTLYISTSMENSSHRLTQLHVEILLLIPLPHFSFHSHFSTITPYLLGRLGSPQLTPPPPLFFFRRNHSFSLFPPFFFL